MPKRTPQAWETLERKLHSAGVSPTEIEAGARRLLAEARTSACRGTQALGPRQKEHRRSHEREK